jgi:hypothetical protein
MPDWDLVGRQHVLAAIAECDRIGSTEFLARYRFPRARAVTLWHGGEEYDPNALLGVAYLHATGRAAGSGELDDALTAHVLGGLGFDVVLDEDALAAAKPPRVRRASPAKPRRTTAASPAPVKVCPTCFMALPATGVCDNCD